MVKLVSLLVLISLMGCVENTPTTTADTTKEIPKTGVTYTLKATDSLSIYDGDTFPFIKDTTKHKIRLYGIDAPEKKQFYGDSSTTALVNLIDGKPITVHVVDTDKYGREIGKIYQDTIYVNNKMVATGNAWWYYYFAKADVDLKESHKSARDRKIGLWRYPNPQNPYEYRQEHKRVKR